MYGAILGDIIGSPYEFDQNNIKTTDFELFSDRSEFTDDSIMTLAVAEALMNCGIDADEETMKKALIEAMKKYGRRYPFAGYGVNFSMWLDKDDPKPYNSFGNGSAMRVSAAAWLCQENLQQMLQIAAITAVVSSSWRSTAPPRNRSRIRSQRHLDMTCPKHVMRSAPPIITWSPVRRLCRRRSVRFWRETALRT